MSSSSSAMCIMHEHLLWDCDRWRRCTYINTLTYFMYLYASMHFFRQENIIMHVWMALSNHMWHLVMDTKSVVVWVIWNVSHPIRLKYVYLWNRSWNAGILLYVFRISVMTNSRKLVLKKPSILTLLDLLGYFVA